ncbi:MAG: nucleotide exchange factor GrpE [Candidatus Dependentiae bacterium]|nr:nucleotide exchange factor GrpE [Candidatus Dependentiae bacterium]
METEKNNKDIFDQNDEILLDQDAELHDQAEQEVNPDDKKSAEQMCYAELSIWKDQCKRISAEFENFKRRTERDQLRWAEMAKESLLQELLSFIDTFDMALKEKNGTDCAGIEMAYQSLIKLLSKHDVSVMKHVADFDPEFHEAVMQVASDSHDSGQVVEILAKGFMLKDRVLRPAKVSVAI